MPTREMDALYVKQGSLYVPFHDITGFEAADDGDVVTKSGTGFAMAAPGAGGGAPTDAKYIVQEANGSLSAEQSLGALTTGVLLNTVTAGVGVLSTASGSDLPSHNHAASEITSGTVDTARLGSGTADNTTFLRGDQTWGTPVGSGMAVLYDSGALGSTAASIDTGAAGIAGGYDVIEVWALLRTDQAVTSSTVPVRVNNDSGANYSYERLSGVNTAASANQVAGATSWEVGIAGASLAAGVFQVLRMTIPFYAETTAHKLGEMSHGRHDTTAANCVFENRVVRWASTAAITRLAFVAPTSQNFIAGSHVIIYGR